MLRRYGVAAPTSSSVIPICRRRHVATAKDEIRREDDVGSHRGLRGVDAAADAPAGRTVYRGFVRIRSVWRAYVFDALVIALALGAVIEVWVDPAQTPRVVTAPAALLWTLPLLLRRRFPLGAPAIVFVTLVAESFLAAAPVTESWVNAIAVLAAFWVAGMHENLRAAVAGAAVGYISMAAIVANESAGADSAPVFILAGVAWALARVLVERTQRTADLERRASRLEREHEAAVAKERTRIARELHDVIAHSVSVMTVQAGAARLLLDDDPSRAREPLLSVEETGRQALADMRRLLGILRGSDERADLAPQPSIATVDVLVDQVRSAGLPTELTIEGECKALPPGVDLTAYRIVQEALTNVLKHAGAARARVSIRYGRDRLALEVTNDGRISENGQPGHGLVGMRERVTLYGGTFEAGPAPRGGYAVRAELPLNPSEP